MPVVAVAVVDIYGDTLQRNVFRPLESQESLRKRPPVGALLVRQRPSPSAALW